ncbi:hypothetical protein MSAN_01767200 [Mycena sanguinolenta]|uniref:Uncharacterized protein n=1 Tax=Mycena sanguinolenta TaxID=230812 RepID=A0A8H7CS06_9AGAR|nr:hypothetical protein MSAN_01767200 [Mycena sanguinolenta]
MRSEALAARRAREKEQKRKKRAEIAEMRRKEQEAAAKEKAERDHVRAQNFFSKITMSEEEGGAGFPTVQSFVESLFAAKRHGWEFDAKLERVLEAEGKAIQALLTRHWTTNVTELLKDFSMEKLAEDLQEIAPTLWRVLARVSIPGKATRRESDGESRREKSLIFTSVCAMLSMSRSQKANNYQVVIGMFLLASGAAKREIEVLAHAGLSVSYSTIQDHIHTLSAEASQRLKQLVKEQMCSIVWDNLNIAFRVESQRLNSANHFDNGTTATAIPIWNPFTNGPAALGTLPLEMKPPRTSTFPVIDWSPSDTL